MKNPFSNLLYQLLYGVCVLLAIAFGLRWALSLLIPILPILLALFILAVLARFLFVRWRR